MCLKSSVEHYLGSPVLFPTSFYHLFQINAQLADGDVKSLRKAVTEKMYSVRYLHFHIRLIILATQESGSCQGCMILHIV